MNDWLMSAPPDLQKGFGEETPTTQFEIEAFFAPYGPTNAIRLRRMADRTFKGSVFVEFHDSTLQQSFLALEPKPKWKGEVDLMWKSKRDYVDEKDRDIKAGRIKPNPSWKPHRNGRREGADQGDWKKRREQDQKSGFRNNRNGRGGKGGHGAKSSGRGGRGGREGRGGRGDGHDRKAKDLQ
jgi:lupus La protein